jgi:hypothetical protein
LRIIQKRLTISVTLVAFLASTSGLALTQHLHHSSADHHSCDLCYKLTIGSSAVVMAAAPLLCAEGVVEHQPVVTAQAPRVEHHHASAAPRAPPAA